MQDVMSIVHDVPMVYLRLKREELGLSRKEFAAIFDMDEDTYRKYEEGVRHPRDNAFRMMKKLIAYYEKEQQTNSIE